jgi:predicted transcriptional regulator
MQDELDLKRDTFRLVRVRADDVRYRSDDLFSLRELILRSDESYPGIGKWLDSKVLAGMRTGERVGFVGLLNEKPIASAVIKRGAVAKFCHLKLEPEARDLHLGDLFFSLMTLEVRQNARDVRFTLPESLWMEKQDFFNGFSFLSATPSARQYRLFDAEFFCQTSFSSLFAAARRKVAGVFGRLAIGDHSLLTGAVLALHPSYLEKIFSKEKTVEFRTRFSKRWELQRVSLYGTKPISGLAGEARIGRVISGEPNKIWELFGHAAGCTRQEYDSYVNGHETVYAVTLTDVLRYPDPVPLSQLSHLLGVNLAAPQSYLSLANNDNWLSAVALSAALQGSITVSSSRAKRYDEDDSLTERQPASA